MAAVQPKIFHRRYTFTVQWTDKINVGVHIEQNDDVYIAINDVAWLVWAAANHRKVVRQKADRAHDAGELPRMPPMASEIYVPRAQVATYLSRYCHRDQAAKAALAAFDVAAFDRRIDEALKKFALRRVGLVEDKIQALRSQIGGLEADRDRWAAKADKWAAGRDSAPAVPGESTAPQSPAEPIEPAADVAPE